MTPSRVKKVLTISFLIARVLSMGVGVVVRWCCLIVLDGGAVQRVRAGDPPKGVRDRVDFEMVRASAGTIVPRTVVIDDAVRARLVPQLVILGAGLDDRAWRMPELAGVEVFEVDHPASQRDKRSRVGDLQPLAK